MIIVHHLENSRSQRVLWLLEELELEYELERYERDPLRSGRPHRCDRSTHFEKLRPSCSRARPS
jgi:glutathione S-transferase